MHGHSSVRYGFFFFFTFFFSIGPDLREENLLKKKQDQQDQQISSNCKTNISGWNNTTMALQQPYTVYTTTKTSQWHKFGKRDVNILELRVI